MRYGNPHMSLTAIASWVGIVALVGASPVKAEKFSITVLPDTQFYSANNPGTFQAQTNWIVANQAHGGTPGDPHPIIYAAHLGDLVNNDYCGGGDGNAGSTQWQRATNAMNALLAAGIPHGVIPGNHDFDERTAGDPPNIFCQDLADSDDYNGAGPENGGPLFGLSAYGGETYHGGSTPGGTNDSNYTLFESAGGVQFIAINLRYSQDALTAASSWADARLKEFSDRRAIITSHFIQPGGTTGNCNVGGSFSGFGQDLWNELNDNPNLFMMLSGHCDGERWLRVLSNEMGRSSCMGRVDAFMSNYQAYGGQNSGNMRVMRIDTIANTLTIDTFSPIGATVGASNMSTSPGAMNTGTASDVTIMSYDFGPIRRPSVVLLPDTSGSMAWDFNGTPGVPPNDQRITRAKEVSASFLDLMLVSAADSSSAGRFNIGVATFPNHPSTGGAAEVVRAVQTNTVVNNNGAKTAINGLSPENATSLLAGLTTANGMFGDQTCKAIVLLSDGFQNDPPITNVSQVTSAINQLTAGPNDTRVFAVGFGQKNEVPFDLLQDLTTGTGGEFYDATENSMLQLDQAYKTFLADLADLDLAVDPIDTIGVGETKAYPVQVTEHDTKLTFYVSWQTLQRGLLDLAIYASNGDQLWPPTKKTTKGVKVVNGTTYRIVTVDRKALTVPGRIGPNPWKLVVKSSRQRNEKPEPFQYSVLLVSGLKFHAKLDRKQYAVGDTITMSAQLREGRRPIAGLKDVTVTITAPEDGRGNWLSTHEVSARQLAQVPAKKGSEPLAPFVRKGLYLTDIAGIPFPGQQAALVVRLYDNGTHGDSTANDGVYVNQFAKTHKEGTYAFHFHAKGPTHNGNRFTRERTVQSFLSVRPTPETLNVTVVPVAGDIVKRFDVQVTPKDPYGNFLGPGHSGGITVAAKGGKVSGPLRDNLDGSYTQTIIVPDKMDEQNVQISVKVGKASTAFNLTKMLDY